MTLLWLRQIESPVYKPNTSKNKKILIHEDFFMLYELCKWQVSYGG